MSLIGLAVWASTGFKTINPASGIKLSTSLSDAFHGDPSGIIYLAIILLIATPVFRVAVSSVYFARAREMNYVLITLAVLSMLLFALFTGSTA